MLGLVAKALSQRSKKTRAYTLVPALALRVQGLGFRVQVLFLQVSSFVSARTKRIKHGSKREREKRYYSLVGRRKHSFPEASTRSLQRSKKPVTARLKTTSIASQQLTPVLMSACILNCRPTVRFMAEACHTETSDLRKSHEIPREICIPSSSPPKCRGCDGLGGTLVRQGP